MSEYSCHITKELHAKISNLKAELAEARQEVKRLKNLKVVHRIIDLESQLTRYESAVRVDSRVRCSLGRQYIQFDVAGFEEGQPVTVLVIGKVNGL